MSDRYSRQERFRGIGPQGQKKLRDAREGAPKAIATCEHLRRIISIPGISSMKYVWNTEYHGFMERHWSLME